MRLGPGAAVALFNGRDGEWRAEVAEVGRRGGVLVCEARLRELAVPCDLWLLFAPIKKARTDFIVEKAVEMGVARIIPVQTQHTNSERIRQDRLQAHAVEAAEQCGATVVPEVGDLVSLDRMLNGWDATRHLMWCDEGLAGRSLAVPGRIAGPWAVLIGPEGGFSDREAARLRGMAAVVPVSLGPRILRADTAVVAALTLWQMQMGDWNAG
ncbi:MAG: 16S rRNA (uracil(1498)-N(3))-methyltransferase [Paracoccaceae bacterium]